MAALPAYELAGCEAQGGGGAPRGREGETVHGLVNLERLFEGNGLFEVGFNVGLQGGPVELGSGYCEGRGPDGQGGTGLAWEAKPEAGVDVEEDGSRHFKKKNNYVWRVEADGNAYLWTKWIHEFS